MVGDKNIPPFFAKPFPTFWLILDDFRFNVHGNGPISRPDGGIFKKANVLLQFCVWAGGRLKKSALLSRRDGAEFFFVKNVQSWAKTDFFHEKKISAVVMDQNCTFFARQFRPDAELQ